MWELTHLFFVFANRASKKKRPITEFLLTMDMEEKKDDEREVWEFMTPLAWHNSIAEKDSVFVDTYLATRDQVVQTAEQGGYDVIVEVGCGTGDVIGEMSTKIPRYGLDINEEFLDFCRRNHHAENLQFH